MKVYGVYADKIPCRVKPSILYQISSPTEPISRYMVHGNGNLETDVNINNYERVSNLSIVYALTKSHNDIMLNLMRDANKLSRGLVNAIGISPNVKHNPDYYFSLTIDELEITVGDTKYVCSDKCAESNK